MAAKVNREKAMVEVDVIDAMADAQQKKGLAEVRVNEERFAVEAKGIEAKADAMKKLDGVGKEHEEFKLRLAKDQAVELAEASQRVVEQATEAVRLATARYNAGTGTQLDVLVAQTDLTTARMNQIQAYHGFNVAVASLRKAMGQADEYVTK